MPKFSAGLLPYRKWLGDVEVFLVHPGGPFWTRKDEGAWSLPKGEYAEGEDPLKAARREFFEETGSEIDGEFLPLGEVRQAGGKRVIAWTIETDIDARAIRSNTFSLEWPPKSGKRQDFPEVDRADWFSFAEARVKMLKGQLPFLDRLAEKVSGNVQNNVRA